MRKQLLAAFAVAAAFFANAAQATVIASNTTSITGTAQGFSKTFALDGNKYTGVTISVTAKGDFGGNYNICDDEYFNFYVDGYQGARWSSAGGSAYAVTENYRDYDYTLSGSFTLSDQQWASLSADKLLTISWQNGADVDAYPTVGGLDYVSFTVAGTLMPSTTPISTAPVTTATVSSSPVAPSTVSTGTSTSTSTSADAGSGASAKVPEPGSLALLGLGLAGLGFLRRRRNKKQ